ncbi:hypothetical protein [Brachybacterium sp. 107]|uniref:hypothetical protein n=1 Tax=Brachybacterium sp. 107 TaxID=3457736 RepID=UPI0040334BFA
MLPLPRRLLPIVAVLLGAPITAEMLQAYLPLTGQLAQSLIAMVFLAPLYGGAALLIREVTVRSGQGWTCTLLLAAAFGLAMQGLIDLAMGGQENPAIPYWSSLRDPTLIPGLGVSVFPTLAWTTGHLMMSVGAPLALVHALAPAHRGRPLLGRLGIPAVLLAGTVIGVQVHIDGRRIFDYVPSFGQVVGVLAVITVLAGLALSPLGKTTRHVQRSEQVTAALHAPDPPARTVSAALVVTAGATAKVAIDLLPPTWLGVAILLTVVAAMSFALRWCSSTRRWGPREVGMLGAGVIIGAILIGFLSPLPAGVTLTEKIVQGMVLLGAAVAAMTLVLRRTAPSEPPAQGTPTGHAP